MSSPEISEDDDSFDTPRYSKRIRNKAKKAQAKPRIAKPPDKPSVTSQTITISSSGEESDDIEEIITSDEDDGLPSVSLQSVQQSRDEIIKKLYPSKPVTVKTPYNTAIGTSKSTFSVTNYGKNKPPTNYSAPPQLLNKESHRRMIGGVSVEFPVPPYGAQIALMSKVIEGMNKGLNCLLESPTGSGKTLALLCGALAWQQHEKKRISALQAQQFAGNYTEYGDLTLGLSAVVPETPASGQPKLDAGKLFSKISFGNKSIYDDSPQNQDLNSKNGSCHAGGNKRTEVDCGQDSPDKNLVTIHKRRRANGSSDEDSPTKSRGAKADASSSKMNFTSSKMDLTSSQMETSSFEEDSKMDVTDSFVSPNMTCTQDSIPSTLFETSKTARVPTIYYGARTHKQIQQVVKEFSRTSYCGEARMTVLSSREYSCIRPFDRTLYSSKNDMCRECVQKVTVERISDRPVPKSNCEYYDRRTTLNHGSLPPAFDLDQLTEAGKDAGACPHYAARLMAVSSQIIFCPYNYLIDPGIRSNLQINIEGDVVILDEAHNIEDICRDAATFTVTRDQVLQAVLELNHVISYEYANQDIMPDLVYLNKCFKNWDDWFMNQRPLLNNQPTSNDEAVYKWQVEHFVKTLDNHNIGVAHYPEYKQSAFSFSMKFRDEGTKLYGLKQSTASLIEAIEVILGYLFRDECKYLDDFKPALIRTQVSGYDSNMTGSWRDTSQLNKTEKEQIALRMMCMNPAVVFDALKPAKCVILSSGTLTPLVSLHSELGAKFPLQVSPNHVISKERVWIGSLTTCPDGTPLECKSRMSSQPASQDALGQAVLWVCQVTPNGVLCFLPSYSLMNKLLQRWEETGLWRKLNDVKDVFMESRNVRDHSEVMDDFYNSVATPKGALLFAVYRGKVSEGMDFKDHQARAVITVGIPYPNTFDLMVKEKMGYNERHAGGQRGLLAGGEWLRVQAYRALNQAVGRCVRHRGDWGAVLLVDARFAQPYYTQHLSKWVRNFLGNNHNTYKELVNNPNGLESFMQSMSLMESEETT